ncbi:hypothetical protein VTK56DRAFT_5062 [Thermocarpiscus australiensis]
MSQKITPKNLHYESTLPPFLARLRGQAASETDPDAPDPILAARRRPGKPRSASAEAEDAPLVVDEHGNTVDVAVGADGSVKDGRAPPKNIGAEETGQHTPVVSDAAPGEKIAGIGDAGAQRRKRKMGRVVGADADEERDDERDDTKLKNGGVETDGRSRVRDTKGHDETAPAEKVWTKKKAKKIKLSFGDDEG